MVLFFDVYEEKESIVLELINGEESSYSISRKYGVSRSLMWTLVETYRNEGIKFARATKPTKEFDIPNNLLAYQPTEHYRDPNIFQIVKDFLDSKSDKTQVLYIWGHSYELEGYNEWDKFEKICEAISNKDGVEYLINGKALLNDNSGVYR